MTLPSPVKGNAEVTFYQIKLDIETFPPQQTTGFEPATLD